MIHYLEEDKEEETTERGTVSFSTHINTSIRTKTLLLFI